MFFFGPSIATTMEVSMKICLPFTLLLVQPTVAFDATPLDGVSLGHGRRLLTADGVEAVVISSVQDLTVCYECTARSYSYSIGTWEERLLACQSYRDSNWGSSGFAYMFNRWYTHNGQPEGSESICCERTQAHMSGNIDTTVREVTYRSTCLNQGGSTPGYRLIVMMGIKSPSPPPPSPPPVANGIQDPHLTGAHGDKMDIRGRHGALYVILSVPRLTFSLRTENATFIKPGYNPKLVHGSFFTDAYWKMETQKGDVFVVNTSASNIGFDVVDPMGTPVASKHGVWTEVNRNDMRVLYKQATLVMRVAGWETNVTRKPVYNRLSGPQWRFDLSIRPLNSTGFESRHGNASGVVSPHGILGQTWDGDSIAVDGAQDDYEHSGAEMWTASMAEGGIEGVVDDYEIVDKFSHDFRYTRYNTSTFAPPRDVSHISGVRRKGGVMLSASAVDQTGLGYR